MDESECMIPEVARTSSRHTRPDAESVIVAIPSLHKVAILGNHLPRQCGIATFTTDLADALTEAHPALDCFVVAMNDPGQRYDYPPQVRFEIDANDIASYRHAATFLNHSGVEVVSVQHEYGIYGGDAGNYLLTLLRQLRMPIVTTLHTGLSEPNRAQRAVMDELGRLSSRLVVMSPHGAALLHQLHGVPRDKIDVILHGIPAIAATGNGKQALGVDGHDVILTFGLLSPDKGIEHVIDAMPAILARHPKTKYVVLGATHPHVKAHEGEAYREMLTARAHALGVADHVVFYNRFVSKAELVEFLAAADIYITPYLNAEQTSSGTLSYAVGAGKAVISTPYVYARELLADGRGILVPWRDGAAIAQEVIGVLDDEQHGATLRQRAADLGRTMLWPDVARAYVRTFVHAREHDSVRASLLPRISSIVPLPLALPPIELGHVRALSDDTGILQHASFSVPRYADGYCLDDNARALLLMTRLEASSNNGESKSLGAQSARYLAFVAHAFDATSGRFRNFMSYARHWLEDVGSEDSHGRALWALGTTTHHATHLGRRGLAEALFQDALPAVEGFTSPRAWAYALLGIEEYLVAYPREQRVQTTGRSLAERLLALYQRTRTDAWPWFETTATYCNPRLAQALLCSSVWLENRAMQDAGLASLAWLAEVQCSAEGDFAPIGSNGFYERGGEKSGFDQQPVEAHAMISACLLAARITKEPSWAITARRAFDWFLGQNELRQALYDPATGACRDGLHADRTNENQGAESTLSFLLALGEMRAEAALKRLQAGRSRS